MIALSVSTSSGQAYPVIVESPFLPQLCELIEKKRYSQVLCIRDRNVSLPELGRRFTVCVAPGSGEELKAIEKVEWVWQSFLDHHLDRASAVVVVGGGAMIDSVGFAASTFMRRIDAVYIPSTLLSQVDSSIGGKNGINLGGIKNLVGTVAHPAAVYIDVSLLSTLPEREFRSGVAEVIKHGIIADGEILTMLERESPSVRSAETLVDVVTKSIMVKADIVQRDPMESGERKKLNFGHTVGHALEAESYRAGNPLTHGEAVSVGMVAELWISRRSCGFPEEEFQRVRDLLVKNGLPTSVPGLSREGVLSAMLHDKKNSGGTVRFAFPRRLGSCGYDIVAPESDVIEALSQIGVS